MSRGNGHELAEIVIDGEILDPRQAPGALEAVTRAEIDTQIATAKRFPRSPARFLNEARSMLAVSPDLAAKCTYRLPVRKGGDKPVEGPSVRLAEIVAVCWGNLRIAGRIIEDDGRMVTAQGIAIDLERNVGYSVEVKRGVTTRDGRRFGDDMIKITCNAAIAIATRNATFKAVPRAFVDLLEDEAQAIARGDIKSLPDRLRRALDWFASKGVAEADVFKALGVVGQADVSLDHLMTLQGYRNSIHEGHATVREVFCPEPETPSKSRTEALKEQLAGKGETQP